jgi:prolyl-tRNA synthetase
VREEMDTTAAQEFYFPALLLRKPYMEALYVEQPLDRGR